MLKYKWAVRKNKLYKIENSRVYTFIPSKVNEKQWKQRLSAERGGKKSNDIRTPDSDCRVYLS